MQGPYHFDEQNDTKEKQAARRRAFGSQKLASVAEQGQEVLNNALLRAQELQLRKEQEEEEEEEEK